MGNSAPKSVPKSEIVSVIVFSLWPESPESFTCSRGCRSGGGVSRKFCSPPKALSAESPRNSLSF